MAAVLRVMTANIQGRSAEDADLNALRSYVPTSDAATTEELARDALRKAITE
jgi:hypothetical protein